MDGNDSAGTAGQILSSTATGTDWIDTSALTIPLTSISTSGASAGDVLTVGSGASNPPVWQSTPKQDISGTVSGSSLNLNLTHDPDTSNDTIDLKSIIDAAVALATPTGSIMAYAGATAPDGWLMCDGSAIPVNSDTQALRNLVGPNTPNLKDRFLRGANGTKGPLLRHTQDQATVAHSHSFNLFNKTIETETDDGGEHWHSMAFGADLGGFSSLTATTYLIDGKGDIEEGRVRYTSMGGEHKHKIKFDISGNIGTSGTGNDIRPDNYGVNYIIKL